MQNTILSPLQHPGRHLSSEWVSRRTHKACWETISLNVFSALSPCWRRHHRVHTKTWLFFWGGLDCSPIVVVFCMLRVSFPRCAVEEGGMATEHTWRGTSCKKLIHGALDFMRSFEKAKQNRLSSCNDCIFFFLQRHTGSASEPGGGGDAAALINKLSWAPLSLPPSLFLFLPLSLCCTLQ